MEKKVNKRYFFVIISWAVFFVCAELIMIFNFISKGNKENSFDFIISMLLIAFVYSLAIFFSKRLKKKQLLDNGKMGRFLIIVFHFLLAVCTFVGFAEASLDSKTTTEQVKNVIMFFKGEKKNIYIESFEIKIDNEKDIYEIGDVINYDVSILPQKANVTALLYKIDNEIVEVDTYNKTITCLDNGKCEIVFYDNHNNDIKFAINIEIYSVKASDILINGVKYDEGASLYLNSGDKYSLNALCIPSNAIDKDLYYKSSNKEVAFADEKGNISALKSGDAIITVTNNNIKTYIYVYVNSLSEIKTNSKEVTIGNGYINRQDIKFYVDKIEGFNPKYLKVINPHEDKLEINYNNYNVSDKWFSFACFNTNDKETFESFDVVFCYNQPFGNEYKVTIKFNLIPGVEIKVSDIDLDNTKLSFNKTIYYDDEGLITKTITNPIIYTNSKKYYEQGVYFESTDNIDLYSCRYDFLNIGLKELDITNEKIEVKFYPCKNYSDFLTFTINLEYKKINNYDSSFELEKLYRDNENKKNEIWYDYFNTDLLEKVIFSNDEFNNSGLMIILSEESKEFLDFEISEFGFINRFELKKKNSFGIPSECSISFEVCSLYEYNKNNDCEKERYTIYVRSELDDLVISLNGKSYNSDDEIYCNKNDVLNVSVNEILDLEYKGDFQKNINFQGYEILSSDIKIASYSWEKNIIEFIDYGIVEISFYLKGMYFVNTHTVIITINVTNEEGIIPVKLNASLDLIEVDEDFLPSDNNYSVDSILQLVPNKEGSYIYSSSNNIVATIDENGVIKCLSQGEVSFVCESVSGKEKVILNINVYDKIYPFEIIKGDFQDITYLDGVYYLSAKCKKMYSFNLGSINDSLNYKYHIDSESGYELSKNGSILFNKEGKYKGSIVCGDDDNPYKETIMFEIEVIEDGIKATFKYFIRKLVGHFGYFLALGVLAFIVMFMVNGFRINKVFSAAVVCLFGMYMAFTTEYIQKTDPSRHYAFSDMVLDCRGYFLGVGIMAFCYVVYKVLTRKKIKKVE